MILLLASTSSIMAADGYRHSGAKFLTIGGGARALALAETYVVEPSDPFALYYNPAAPEGHRPTGLGLAHNSHFQNTHGEYAVLRFPAGKLRTDLQIGAGVGMQWFAVNDIPRRTGPSEEPLALFDAADAMISGSVSLGTADRRVGIAVKGIFEKISSEVANGVAFDLGGVYRIYDCLVVGAAFNHLGPEMSFNEETFKLPGLFRLGGSWAAHSWTLRSEVVSPFHESSKLHFGGEYVLRLIEDPASSVISDTRLALRAGYAFGYDTRSWAAGFGVGVNRMSVDYAYVPYGDDLGNTHHFAIVITLQ
jgi:hypothetical protein